jgi:hypothetical protein
MLTGFPHVGDTSARGAHSSAVEHSPYKRVAIGSNPIAPTIRFLFEPVAPRVPSRPVRAAKYFAQEEVLSFPSEIGILRFRAG